MTWVNIPIEFFMSDQFRGSEPTDRATWLALMGYCHTQENGGRIVGAKAWKDRKCQQVLAVTLSEMNSECCLWHWDGDDLIVHHYPIETEQKVKASRDTGKESAMKRWHPNREPNRVPIGIPNGSKQKTPDTKPELKPEPERNINGNHAHASARTSEREEIDPIAIRALVVRYANAIGKPASNEADKDIVRSIQSGEPFESLSSKVDAIISVLKTQPKTRLQYQYSPARFFAEEFWRNDPETFKAHESPDGDTVSMTNQVKVRH